jgi:hypothetical protein
MSPRHVRAYLEAALDEIGWTWCRRISFWLDGLVIRQEREESVTGESRAREYLPND